MSSLAPISLNFDSIREAVGFPDGFRDPSFNEVADRFLQIADKMDFRYSIYVIGRDLEDPKVRKAVKTWAEKGHEIGNHSWSHHMNLGSLPKEEIRREVAEAHKAIHETTGIEPKGFIAPAWCATKDLREVLCELGYEYDTSSVPSWVMYAALARIAFEHRQSEKFKRIVNRKDIHRFALDSKEPFAYKNLNVFPLPTGLFGTACWHTMGFIFGWNFHNRLLKSCLNKRKYFYYLVHPADLTVAEDIPENYRHHLVRMTTPLEEKMRRFEDSIQMILKSGRKICTLREMNQYYDSTAASALK